MFEALNFTLNRDLAWYKLFFRLHLAANIKMDNNHPCMGFKSVRKQSDRNQKVQGKETEGESCTKNTIMD